MLIQALSDGDQIRFSRLLYVAKTNNDNSDIVIFQLSIGIITSHYIIGRLSERMDVILLRYRVSQR